MRKKYLVRPLAHILRAENAPLNSSPLAGQWPCLNVRVSSNRIERRWDHETYRTFASGDVIQAVPTFRTNTGTYYTLVLTDTDVARLATGTGETYQYLTPTYVTGLISGVSGTAITGDVDVNWATGSPDLNAGDKFIINADHSAAVEPDIHWATISSVDSDTGITLTGAYAGAATSGAYKIRKVLSVPSGERWTYASVGGKFCFMNGNVQAQYWNGTDTYATDLNTTYANQARYCLAYANRLVIADIYSPDTAARNPQLLRWSENGDPTDFTDTTAGYNDFIDTEDAITGLGVSGDHIVVFKKTSYHMGYQSGTATSALEFPSHKRGIGLYAPYSLAHCLGTVVWMGMDDFYMMNGDTAVSIGGPIRKTFFDLVPDDNLERVFCVNNARYNEIMWVASTDEGQYTFVWNWKDDAWTAYTFNASVTGLGGWNY